MARLVKMESSKYYATERNAIKAVQKLFPDSVDEYQSVRFMVLRNAEGRFIPIFMGQNAVKAGAHLHFITIA